MRLPTKPKPLPTVTPILPARRASAWVVASAAAEDEPLLTISTRRMTWAGLKKCMPTTSAGLAHLAHQRPIRRRTTLGKKQVPERLRLDRILALDEKRAGARKRRFEWQHCCRGQRLDDPRRRRQAALGVRHRVQGVLEIGGVGGGGPGGGPAARGRAPPPPP